MSAELVYPVVWIARGDYWRCVVVLHSNRFRYWAGQWLRPNLYQTLMIFDASGKQLEVVGVGSVRNEWRFWRSPYIIGSILAGTWLKDVKWDLCHVKTLELDDLKRVLRDFVQDDPSFWHEGKGSQSILKALEEANNFEETILAVKI